jgi:hypothetical protein
MEQKSKSLVQIIGESVLKGAAFGGIYQAMLPAVVALTEQQDYWSTFADERIWIGSVIAGTALAAGNFAYELVKKNKENYQRNIKN